MSRTAGVYTRISDDATDDADERGLGVKRQETDCRALAKRLGWTVAGVFCDNDVSAYSLKRPRPQYRRLLGDLEAGRLDALVCWDVDRLTRHPIELEDIIDLADRKGIALASVGGEIDLGTPQGRLTARIKASVARHEVEQSSRRIRRAALERAEKGKPHGRQAYGWQRVNGQDVIDEKQAAVVREATERLIAGESLRSIAADFDCRSVPTPNGPPSWHPVMLRQVVLRVRNAGLRVHQKKVIGKGDWEPIVSEDLYQRLVAILKDPARRSTYSTRHKHLLSGIALCGLCGHSLRSLVAHGTLPSAYACPGCFKVRRKQADVDSLISELVIARLARPDALQALLPSQPDVQPMVERAAAIRARLDVAADQFADDAITGEQLARITAKLRPELGALEREINSASAVPDVTDLAAPDIAERWDGLPLERQRAVIDMLMEIRILPANKKGRAEFDPSRIEIEWR